MDGSTILLGAQFRPIDDDRRSEGVVVGEYPDRAQRSSRVQWKECVVMRTVHVHSQLWIEVLCRLLGPKYGAPQSHSYESGREIPGSPRYSTQLASWLPSPPVLATVPLPSRCIRMWLPAGSTKISRGSGKSGTSISC